MIGANENQDEMLRSYIKEVFQKYDKTKKGTLNQFEMTEFFNDLFKSLGLNTTIN